LFSEHKTLAALKWKLSTAKVAGTKGNAGTNAGGGGTDTKGATVFGTLDASVDIRECDGEEDGKEVADKVKAGEDEQDGEEEEEKDEQEEEEE
jgi:hypothetical protein